LKPQPFIGKRELTLDDIRQLCDPQTLGRLTDVHLCGNYGDPACARDCLAIVDFFCSGRCAVSISTNGGVRGAGWWRALAGTLGRNPRSRVDFHIDGLADTNAFYRRHTRFERIMANARAFIAAGGRANWEFIPFRHNEHQVTQARELSRSMGFARFTLKKSNRFFANGASRVTFTAPDGRAGFLEAPSTRFSANRANNRLARYASPDPQGRIHCLAALRHEVYVSCEAVAYPCCWTARLERTAHLGGNSREGFAALFARHAGRNEFNLRRQPLSDRLGRRFAEELRAAWREGQPAVCHRKCGRGDQPEKVKMAL
jgi:hypothetical protein